DHDGRRELSRGPALPPRARLGPDRRGRRHARRDLVRPGRPGRGRLLRPAAGRRHRHEGRVLRRGGVREGGLGRHLARLGRDRRGQRGALRRPREDQRRPLRRGVAREGPDDGPVRARQPHGGREVRGYAGV
ncbi:MAG: Glycine cleavage system H protein, partial [uncultured Solirubrobacteraceae bacterium]